MGTRFLASLTARGGGKREDFSRIDVLVSLSLGASCLSVPKINLRAPYREPEDGSQREACSRGDVGQPLDH